MRRIVTAITAISLAFSLVAATATPANAAVAGYDSAYAGESAFLNIPQGQAGTFTVFFANTGSTSWVKSTSTQVDLAACLEDKVTCNTQDASEAPFNSGWLSTSRYATTTQTTVAPGQIGTFTYNVAVPAAQAAATYRFNGALVLAASGADIRNEGYYQDVTVGGGFGAASITSLTPNTGTTGGGTSVNIAGSGIVCTPAFPTVSFGGTNGSVTSCGASALTVSSPAHAAGAVTVTVTNSGGTVSNGLTYTFADTSSPVFQSFTVSGSLVTVTFSEPICSDTTATNTAPADWSVLNVSAATTNAVLSDGIPDCNAARDNGVTTAVLQLTSAMPNGAFVEATLNANVGTTNINIEDAAGNFATAPQARQATATAPETTAPTITSVTGAVGSTTVTVTFSEPVYCSTGLLFDSSDITLDDSNSATVDPTATAAGSNACGSSPTTADTSFSFTVSSALPADRQYTLTLTPEANEIQDIVGNDLATPSSFLFTTGAGDFTPPTIVDARVVNNLLTTDFTEAGDSFSATFSEVMNGTTTGTLQIQDQDGTVFTLTCSTGGNVSCTWNTAVTTVTVTVTTTIPTIAVGQPGAGSTPGMQIPFNITTLNGFTDLQGNVPNVLGSPDRLVDYE